MRWLFAIALIISSSALAAPFPTTDQNPLLSGFAPTLPNSARLPVAGTQTLSATINWSNTAIIQSSDTESLVVDAESREWRLSFQQAITDKISIQVQLPYRTFSGGTLDGFIENWHGLSGLPNGDRPDLPQNDLRIDYRRSGQTVAAYSSESSGIGDLLLAVGYQLGVQPNSATSAWVNLKLPTADRDQLAGSGALDLSINLAHEQKLSSRWLAFAQVGGAYLGTGHVLASQQTHWVASGLLGFDYRYSQALTLTIQLDGRTSVFKDSSLHLLGNTWILTTGGEYRFASGWRAQFGLGEDIKVRASPDVTFVFCLKKELGGSR